MDLKEKALALKSLHETGDAFIIANAWDPGSARLLERSGFKALATTSAGLAYSMAKPNGRVGRDATLRNASEIAWAVDLPVSADLENGFGLTVEDAVETISAAIRGGLAGGSIEDITYREDPPVLDVQLASERINACAEVIRNRGIAFQLVARADNFLIGREDLATTIARLQAYQEAGADVLYAPGLRTEAEIRAVVSSVDLPVNVVMGLVGSDFTVTQLQEWGVTRVSVGSALHRLGFGALDRAAKEMREKGAFTFASEAPSVAELDRLFG